MILQYDESEDFKCVLCKELFSPPYNLPYLLPCTHSICTNCLSKVSANHNHQSVICPEDLQTNMLSEIRLNTATRKALERLVKQHKNFSQNHQLFRIQSLCKHFEQILEVKSNQKDECKQLFERIIETEISRLRLLQKKLSQQLQGPFKKVDQWRTLVKEYLCIVKQMDRNRRRQQICKQLNFYIEQGRRIKLQLSLYQKARFAEICNLIVKNPKSCLETDFSVKKLMEQAQTKRQISKNTKQNAQNDDLENHISNSKASIKEQMYKKSSQSHIKACDNQKAVQIIKREPLADLSIKSNLTESNLRKSKTDQSYYKDLNIQSSYSCGRKSFQQEKISKNPTLLHHNYGITRESDQKQNFFMLSEDDSVPPLKQDLQSDEILLTDKQEYQQVIPNVNFLQQWQLVRSLPSQHIATRKRQPFNWQKQKNQYIRKMQLMKVEQAKEETSFQNGCLQLINYPLCQVQIYFYLQCWNWKQVETVKFVRTGFTDNQLNDLLNFMLHSKVETLVLSGNNLTEASLDALLNFVKMNKIVHNVYISKNNINLLKGHSRQKVSLLRQQGINLYT